MMCCPFVCWVILWTQYCWPFGEFYVSGVCGSGVFSAAALLCCGLSIVISPKDGVYKSINKLRSKPLRQSYMLP